jgi:two-component system sensor histidine kinase RegB
VAPHRNFGVTIEVMLPGERRGEPAGARNPAILYGLGNLLENAVDFAKERVVVGAQWSEDAVEVSIADDGAGFAPEVLGRIGEPYVTTRRRNPHDAESPAGLGLGFFIAKTLLERSGATLNFENRSLPERGAMVRVRWRREDFERPLTLAAA